MISEQLTQLSNIKADIKSALQEKGQNPGNTFSTYANLIRAITVGDFFSLWQLLVHNYTTIISRSTFYGAYSSDTNLLVMGNVYNLTDNSNIVNNSFINMFLNNTTIKYFDCRFSGKSSAATRAFSGCSNLEYASFNANYFTNMSNVFENCSKLKIANITDINNVTNFTSMFYGCTSLKHFPVEYSLGSTFTSMFRSCYAITEINNMYFPNASSCYDMFGSCTNLKSITFMNYGSGFISNMNSMFNACPSLVKIDGLSFKGMTSVALSFYSPYNEQTALEETPKLRHLGLINIGMCNFNKTNNYTFIFSSNYYKYWGKPDANESLSTNARQSLIDTLITNSYDRSTNGYTGTCTIQLHADTKALLTTNEIAQITAKGYTLA